MADVDEVWDAIHELRRADARLEQDIRDIRGDLRTLEQRVSDGFGEIRVLISERMAEAMNSIPQWAAERLQDAERRTGRYLTLVGIVVTLASVAVATVVALLRH
ncbi:MAG: hypothetical protein QJR03_15035 [Sphaerobacter sp.]|nr:hypothetical protein [Sphaerobacter sp.]